MELKEKIAEILRIHNPEVGELYHYGYWQEKRLSLADQILSLPEMQKLKLWPELVKALESLLFEEDPDIMSAKEIWKKAKK